VQRVATNPALTEAVVAALAANGTATARQILERLVAGTQPTADPQVASMAALKALLCCADQGSEDLVFRVVTASETEPTAAAAADRAAIDQGKLRAAALEWVKASASGQFRLRLANYMTATETPQTIFEQIWASLRDARFENVAAQVVLYRSERLADSSKQLLERQFAAQSRAALRGLLGFPLPKSFTPQSDAVTASNDPRHAAKLLWADEFTTVVEGRLRAAEGTSRGAQLLSLTCTFPRAATRATVLQSLEKYWEEGPKRFDALIATDESLPEPGFLLAVKQLPRKEARPASPGGAPSERTGSRTSAAKAAKSAAARKVKERQDHAAQQWLAYSENLAQAMCRQFWAAAIARRESLARPESDAPPSDVPVKIPANASIVASHDVRWPEDCGKDLEGLSLVPLRVHYVRMERKARPDKVAGYFRRQMPAAAQHINDHSVWLDEFAIDKKTGRARSVDVFVSKPNKDVGIVLDQEQQVIVEILTIECLPQTDN
jgi:hypothetical protein